MLKILKLENITEIVLELHRGKTTVLPSETSYGLSCDATNQAAVNKIFQIKGRDPKKSVLVVVDSIAEAKKYLEWNEALDFVEQNFWDNQSVGPVTVVGQYHKKFLSKHLAQGVVSEQGTLAVRVTHHPLLKILCQKMGRPLVSTSANIAGGGENYDPAEIGAQFENSEFQPDFVVDAGVLPVAKPSTIVSVLENKIAILRQGEVVV